MMTSGMSVNQRDIILIPFPYSDLTQTKKRPSIIISNQTYNSNNEDVICCAITSNPRNYDKSIEIANDDLDKGNLRYESRVKPTKIFTLDKGMIVKKLAKLNINKSKEIIANLNQSIEINESVSIDIK
ncbi:MAG: type II toxin-antitoxin system PemK/MazF family toxin [Methanosarcinales archaeon]|nr:type II toxin-antitoxin system PemK/MazF family toxin [Methanosarcinales archaeon]